MSRMLNLYKTVAEKETGFWLDLPVDTGQLVSRDEWLHLAERDPEHFQLVSLTTDGLTRFSIDGEGVVEHAVFVTWSDEKLH